MQFLSSEFSMDKIKYNLNVLIVYPLLTLKYVILWKWIWLNRAHFP